MQGTAADVIKVAMVRIHERLRHEGRAARLVLQVHDELLLEVPEVETTAVKELVREEMVGAYRSTRSSRSRSAWGHAGPPQGIDVGATQPTDPLRGRRGERTRSDPASASGRR